MNKDRIERILFDRLSAGALLLFMAPLLLARALVAKHRTGKYFDVQTHIGQDGRSINLKRFSGISRGRDLARLIDIAAGRLAWVGPQALSVQAAEKQAAQRAAHKEGFDNLQLRPGFVSLWRLQRMTGSQYEGSNNPADYPNHSLKESIAIVLRFALVKLMSSNSIYRRAEQFDLLEVTIDNLAIGEAMSRITTAVEKNQKSRFAFVNPDCLNIAYKHSEYAAALSRVDTIFADGIGIRMGCRMLGIDLKDNINGTDLFPLICDYAVRADKSIYLLGGKPDVAATAEKKLCEQHPGLHIAGTSHGYFPVEQTEEVIERINASGADILLVAFGAPRQELWIEQHFEEISTSVQMGVGGLFDFYSGRISRSPRWLRDVGMEWTWRLLQEPKRMWRRYVIGNPLFLWRVWNQSRKDPRRNIVKRFSTLDSGFFKASVRYKLHHFAWTLALFAGRAARRLLDISVSGMAILMLTPLLLIVIGMIKLESSGPAVFSQTRVGRWGNYFTMYKFRSMCSDAEAQKRQLLQENEMQGGVLFKMKEDPRITRVGKFIRKYSIDELPQFWNVLIGDMSLVGPRPPVPSEVDQYSISDRRRLEIKPGITCLWQVSGRSEIPFDEQVELDVDYIESQGITHDLRILLRTIPAVLLGKGSY